MEKDKINPDYALNKISLEFCNDLIEFFVKIAKKCKTQPNIKNFLYTLSDYITGINILIEGKQHQIVPTLFNKHFLIPYAKFIKDKDESFFLEGDTQLIEYNDKDKSEILEQINEIRKIYVKSSFKIRTMVWLYIIELKRLGNMYEIISKKKQDRKN